MKIISSAQSNWPCTVVGVTLLFAVTAAQAAFVSVPAGNPSGGALLAEGSAAPTVAGLVLASQEAPFFGTIVNLPSSYSGILRSMVVDTGAGYDFYYQVINTSLGPIFDNNDIFRLAIPGYDQGQIGVQATYLNDGVATIAGLGGVPAGFTSTFLPNKGANGAVFSADRDLSLNTARFLGGGAAFDFDPSQFPNMNPPGGPTTAPQNIETGENSSWLVLRTDAVTYNTVFGAVVSSGGGTGLATAFAPIPEPSTVLFGVAMFAVCAGGRVRKARRTQPSGA
jgi:hypothetical protein